MAVKTVQKANSTWSDTTNWNGGTLPVSGDSVVCNSPNIVTFDVDTSGMAAGIAGISGTGTLQVSTTAGTYQLKTTAAISVSHFIIGTSLVSPLPANVTFILLPQGNINCVTSADFQCYCQDSPTHLYCKLSQAANAGDTVLNVDTDLTGGGDSNYWKLNAWGQATLVNIDNINQNNQSEQRTISAVSSTQITISAGLTNSKLSGSYIILASRNVKLVGTGATGTGVQGVTAAANVNMEVRNINNGFLSCKNQTIGGVITNVASAGSSCNGCTFNGPISAASSSGLGSCSGCTLNGLCSGSAIGVNAGTGVIQGAASIITGCNSGITASNGMNCAGQILNSQQGINTGTGYIFRNATLSNNLRDLNSVGSFEGYGATLGSATQFLSYNTVVRALTDYGEIFDNGAVSGAYKNWCVGGIVTSNTGTVYGTRTRSYQHALELTVSNSYSFRDQVIQVPAGGWINVYCYIQKDASMTYLPRVQIFPASVEPLISGAASAETQMTNSTNTWEVLFAKYQNTTTAPQLVKVRVIAQNASGSVYEDTDISISPFGFATGVAA